MSIGYIPKRRAKTARMRKARKKYKNFSCYTCVKCHNLSCRKRYHPTPYGSLIITYYENCPDWKFDKDYIYIPPEKLGIMVSKKKKN